MAPGGRPLCELEAAKWIKQIIFPDSSVLWTSRKRKGKQSTLVRSKLHKRLDDMLACTSLVEADPCLCHWCEVVSKRKVRGAPGGMEIVWCCKSIAEAMEKTDGRVVAWVLGNHWFNAANNRWTVQPINERRYLISDLVVNTASQSIRKLRVNLDLHRDTTVETLKKLLNEDRDIFFGEEQTAIAWRLHGLVP